jgi:transcriptional regulator with XRE-family HTH domain
MEISDRLEQLITKLGETPNSFSEKLGVQRSSLSHLLSARNKPSVDFFEKLLAVYPSLNLTWLITGNGEMMANEIVAPSKQNMAETILGQQTPPSPSDEKVGEKLGHGLGIHLDGSMKPTKVMLFYANGTFEIYEP